MVQTAPVGEAVRVGDLKKRRFTLPQAAQILKIEADLLRKTGSRVACEVRCPASRP